MEPIDRSLIKRLQEGKITRRDFIVAAATAGVSLSGIVSILASSAPTLAFGSPAASKTKFPGVNGNLKVYQFWESKSVPPSGLY
jgi:hypothetical protein